MMKKLYLIMIVFLLAGCGAGNEGEEFIGHWANQERKGFEMDITREDHGLLIVLRQPKNRYYSATEDRYPATYEKGILNYAINGRPQTVMFDKAKGTISTEATVGRITYSRVK